MKQIFSNLVILILLLNNSKIIYCQKNNIEFLKDGAELHFFTEPQWDSIYVLNNHDSILITPQKYDLNYFWKITLNHGDNNIKVELQDDNGNVYVGDTLIKYYKPFGYWILSVGTGDNHETPLPPNTDLLHSVSDASRFAETIRVLVEQEPELTLVINDSSATKDGIKAAIDSIKNDIDYKSINEMTVIVYLSGHGKIDEKGTYYFQVKDYRGYDEDWIDEEVLANWLRTILDNHKIIVWLFVDSCNSTDLYSNNSNLFKGISGSVIRYSSQIVNGDKLFYSGNDVKDKSCKNANDVIQKVFEDGNLKGRAIDGLFEHLFEQAVTELPIKDTLLNKQLSSTFNNYIGDRELIRLGNEERNKVYFPGRVIKNTLQSIDADISEEQPPCGFIDIAVGYNLSRQGNIQIGYSWPSFSAFVECSGAWHWTDSITHILEGVEEKMPSKRIGEFGVGIRHYPFSYGKLDIGYGLSIGLGYIHGEKMPLELIEEPKKDNQLYCSFTPVTSFRFYTSKNHRSKFFFNVGYRFYLPCKIDENIKWRSAVTSFGVSIPINN